MGLSTQQHMAVMGTGGPMGRFGPATCGCVQGVHVRHVNSPGRMSRTSQPIDFQRVFKVRPGRPGDSPRTHVHTRGGCAGAGVRGHAYARMTIYPGRILKVVKRLMKSITCNVHDKKTDVDVVDGLLPVPTSIKDQMPLLAQILQVMSGQLGRDAVQVWLKTSMALRRAFDADDYRAVNAIYRSGKGWIDWQEAGYCIGVPGQAMSEFAKRHRSTRT